MACDISTAKQLLKESLINHYDMRELNNIVRYYFEDKFPGKKVLNDHEEDIFFEDINKLRDHCPLQYVVGKAYFFDRYFDVNPATLIPRPETEELVRLVLDELKNEKSIEMLDIGTGSGCISVILSATGGFKNITAVDIDQKTLETAAHNAENYNCSINFKKIDFLNEKEWKDLGKIECIVSNPPYISYSEKPQMAPHVLNYEPHSALFADDPLIFYKAISKYCDHHELVKFVYLELNALFAKETRDLFMGNFKEVDLYKDLQGKNRILVAKR